MTRTQKLLAEVAKVLDTQGRGSRRRLCEYLDVRPQRLNDWLHDECEPSGEIVLALVAWLESVKGARKVAKKRKR